MAVSVSPATPAEWPAAGRMLFAAGEPGAGTARFLALIAAGEIDPAGVFVARDRDGVFGAMLAQPFAGGQAAAWPPAVPAGPGRERVEDALAAAALGWLRAGGAKVVQALLRPGEPGVPALERAGFGRMTELAFLARDLSTAGAVLAPSPLRGEGWGGGGAAATAYPSTPYPNPPPKGGRGTPPKGGGDEGRLTIDPYCPANASAFAGVLMASYDGTRDCPELNGTRSADEVVTGYRDAGPGGSREWFLASAGRTPVGVLLLAGPPAGAWVLTYLGVVPAARGRGVGRALTRFAVRRAAAAAAPGLTLNVDVRNAPALAAVRRRGVRRVRPPRGVHRDPGPLQLKLTAARFRRSGRAGCASAGAATGFGQRRPVTPGFAEPRCRARRSACRTGSLSRGGPGGIVGVTLFRIICRKTRLPHGSGHRGSPHCPAVDRACRRNCPPPPPGSRRPWPTASPRSGSTSGSRRTPGSSGSGASWSWPPGTTSSGSGREKFGEAVRAAAAEVAGEAVPVRFVTDPDLFTRDENPAADAAGTPVVRTDKAKAAQPNLFGDDPLPRPRKKDINSLRELTFPELATREASRLPFGAAGGGRRSPSSSSARATASPTPRP